MDNYFQCASKNVLTFFQKKKICLSVLGAAKTKSGYNTCCISFCSAMIGICIKWTVLMSQIDCANARFRCKNKVNAGR